MSKSECIRIFMANPTKRISLDELSVMIPITAKNTLAQNCFSLFKDGILIRDYEMKPKKRGSRKRKTMVYQINLDYYRNNIDKWRD